jgi:hypothetical protein
MRPKVLIFATIILLAILAILFWQYKRQSVLWPTSVAEVAQSVPSISNIPAGIQNPINQSQSQSSLSPSQLPVINDRDRTNEIRQMLEAQNKPIEFFGRVIDQDGNPLSGVKLKGKILHLKVIVPAPWGSQDEIVSIEKNTDQNGQFEVDGVSGRSFEIESIQKNNYEAEPWQHTFGTESGSFLNPIIFKMWSTNIHEQLITGEKKFQIFPDGRSYFIDLTAGTIAESGRGDLKVWIQYTNQIVKGQIYDWSAEIDAIDGGLCLGDSYSMFSAPADGYVPKFSLQQQIKGGQRGSIGDKKFYVMFNNGKIFGRIQIDLIAPFNDQVPGLIRLSYAINPSGSRILR